ncbi:MAG TPA: DUF4179 domain-containing protein [Candidatus Limnocylindria bacterium]|nr:DUF4179 domain-containing protein [Candidatus Limnocylindria bacterium]
MTTREDIEARLVRAVSVDPSEDGLRWLDQRVARRMAEGAPAAAGSGRGARSLRLFLRPLAVVAAFVLLTGAVIGGVSLLDRLSEQTPGWRVAYDAGELVGIAQTDAGYTITLERAYGDLNQVIAFFTIESAGGMEAPTAGDGFAINHFALNAVTLQGPAGSMPIARTATADLEPNLAAAAEAFQFDAPLVGGRYQLSIREIGFGADGPDCVSPCMEDAIVGSWQFDFDLPAPAGTTLALDATDTVGQATLHLTELQVSPTMIRARISLEVDGRPVSAWSGLPMVIAHLGAQYEVNSDMAQYVGDPRLGTGQTLFFTTEGSDGVSGTWEIRIRELSYQLAGEDMITVTGPWTLTVTVP